MIEPIKYKFVMDHEGVLTGVELWQDGQHITISMGAEGTHKVGYRWLEIKKFLDSVHLPVHNELDAYERYLAKKKED